MQNPKHELRKYLKTLIHRFLNTKSLYQELKRIEGWEAPGKFEAFKLGAGFLELSRYTLWRIFLTEIAATLSSTEEKSLIDWLKKARQHAPSLEPTRYNPNHPYPNRQAIQPQEYRTLIDAHISCLNTHQDLITRIKTHRDKVITHFDKAYFENPKKLDQDYPLSDNDITPLLTLVSEIFRKHHGCLFKQDPRMDLLILTNVDNLLRYARAFLRVRSDRVLIRKGFKPMDYMRDD